MPHRLTPHAPVAGPALSLVPEDAGRAGKFQALAKVQGDHAEILIYATIGESFWGDTITSGELVNELTDLDVSTITLRINSPGGSVTDGWAIANALKRHRAVVTAYVDGLCGSIATAIALAASSVVMAPNSLWMIHNPSGVSVGEAHEHRKTAEILDTMRAQMIATYVARSTKTADEIGAAMDEETWLDPEQTVAWGFADAISDAEVDIAATAHYMPDALETFRHAPRELVASIAAGPLATHHRQTITTTDTDETDGPGKVVTNENVKVDERALAVLIG